MRTLTKVSLGLIIFFSTNCWAGPRFALPKESEFKAWPMSDTKSLVAVHKGRVLRLRPVSHYFTTDLDNHTLIARRVTEIPGQNGIPQLLHYKGWVAVLEPDSESGVGKVIDIQVFSYFYEMKKDVLRPWRKSWHMVKKCEGCTENGSRLTHLNFLEKKYKLRTDLIWW